MGDPFYRIRLTVREVVSRINAPLVAGAVMRRMKNPIHYGISHVEVGRCHVDFCPEGSGAVGKFSRLHAFEQVEILFNGSFSVGTILTGLG